MARSFLDTGLRGSLIVDDEPGVLKATQILLEVEGYRVSTAKSMADAVAVARTRQDIEVLVTDYHLAKDELGTSVIAAVREVLGDHLGCILISGIVPRQ
jgi:DNA-binding NtrC family response regulator